MKVELAKLKPNPFRDFKVDPIDPENVKALIESIKEDGFWGGVVARRTWDGIELAAGHTRREAALKAGIETADIFVGDFSDDQMIRIYARENSTQRGNSTTAVAGSVISAVRFLAKGILTDDPECSRILQHPGKAKQNLMSGEGIGEPLIEKFLHGVPRMNRYIIKEQLATLKTSGDYQRVIAEVTAEIEAENKSTDASRKASENVLNYKPEFNFSGVAPYMQNEHQMRVFRETVLKPGMKEILPVSQQPALARHLIEKARADKEEISARYIRENASILARNFKDEGKRISREEKEARSRIDTEFKFNNLCDDFRRHAMGLAEVGNKLIELIDANPGFGFRMPDTMKMVIRHASEILNKLTRAI